MNALLLMRNFHSSHNLRGGSHSLLGSQPTSHHGRSASAAPPSSSPRNVIQRSGSVSALSDLAAVAAAPGLPKSKLHMDSELRTLPDPRSPHDDFPSPERSAASSPHPDLDSEVATLSNKLISAINHQTNLDDALAATRQELEASQDRLRALEAEKKSHEALVSTKALVPKAEVEAQATELLAKLADEKMKRMSVEKDKKGIEQELENLTTALFEEANQMVAAARREREAAERRNEQLRTQLHDTELLLASHQEQLAELKSVMEKMNADRDEQDTAGPTTPSTPALPSTSETIKALEALQATPAMSGIDDTTPAPPTTFFHLISPVLRTDFVSYEDFRALLKIAKQSAPRSRVNSGSYAGVTIPGPTNFANREGQPHAPSNGSTASLSMPGGFNQSTSTSPGAPASNQAVQATPLKETRFYKRALTEDIEPTLRLDTAPGLSWLARRTVINSMSDGTLVVEPMPVSSKVHIFPCALCGEARKGEPFTRTHRFRTNESETAQRYPLCAYCLNRVRSTCSYLGFLRMVIDGHWRTDGVEAEKVSWEESVRLRERMFWARIGGGVVPASGHKDSPRPSVEEGKPVLPCSAPPVANGGSVPIVVQKRENGGVGAQAKLTPVSKSVTTTQDSDSESDYDWETAKNAAIFDTAPPPPLKNDWETKKKSPIFDNTAPPKTPVESPGLQLHTSLRESLRPRQRSRAASYEKERTNALTANHSQPQRSSTPQRGLTVQRALTPTGDQGLQISIPGPIKF